MEKPPVTNEPTNILWTWTALEVLSPQSYKKPIDLVAGDGRRIANLNDARLPWESSEKPPRDKRLHFEVILGTIDLDSSIAALLNVYSDNRPDPPQRNGVAAIATVLLDEKGRPLDDETTVAISSFAWGVPMALDGDLKALAKWPETEYLLKQRLAKALVKRDDDGEIISLSRESITEHYKWLVSELRASCVKVSPPEIAIRQYDFAGNRKPPEPILLNSFFLQDLADATSLVQRSQTPDALQYYLGISQPTNRLNLLADNKNLISLLEPQKTPIGRWPGKGRFPLAVLQQAAINTTTDSTNRHPVIAVNGPPGTGKTTLLRDIVAAQLVERAEIMAGFDDPADSFVATEASFRRNGATVVLHRIDDRLKGFEMIVASTNNKGAENVSAELPAMDSIAEDATELRYFQSISDSVFERKTWGLIAAVLGNKSNQYKFSQSFWRDDENGFATYLNQACGIPQVIPERNDDGSIFNRPRRVVERENPPSDKQDALQRWREAKDSFQSTLDEAVANRNVLQKLHETIQLTARLSKQQDALEIEIKELDRTADGLRKMCTEEKLSCKKSEAIVFDLERQLASHLKRRPGWPARLLRLQPARQWKRTHRLLKVQLNDKKALEAHAIASCQNRELKLKNTVEEQTEKRAEWTQYDNKKMSLTKVIESEKLDRNCTFPDEVFFKQDQRTIQLANAWFTAQENKVRDNVFESVMALHRAFIDAAADPIRQNLAIFMGSFGTRSLGTRGKDRLIPDLWSTLFFVVPVVSTTFASMHRMFSRIPVESLGWLLVDEAGQALPQAAVGALMRVKKAVIVGDPLQIEPVVSLPETLTEEICGHFGVEAVRYNAPDASVQTLADSASPYFARFPSGVGYRDVGMPLLVHRRCDSPMFEISNDIAYSNFMVQGKKANTEHLPCGPSRWIDIKGRSGPDKWCEDEADALIGLLGQMRSSEVKPDFYIVTPFRVVQFNLRDRLVESRVLNGWVENPRKFVDDHVGTVHTVQGREANTVFFVLGAQDMSQHGARSWAGGSPNLANVAVTRAKSAFYVIGNRERWKTAGVFETLDKLLV